MVKLIKYFNEVYGQQYGNIEYPRKKKEIYQTYQIIKAYGIKDDTLMSLLNEVVLPKPTSIKEKEMYSECLYEIGKNDITFDDLICNKECFLELTFDDFKVVEPQEGGVKSLPFKPTNISNEPKEISAKGIHKMLCYAQSPKIDWLNTENDKNSLYYEIYMKIKNPETNNVDEHLIISRDGHWIFDTIEEDEIPLFSDDLVNIINNAITDYENLNIFKGNGFGIEIKSPFAEELLDYEEYNILIDFKFKLFKKEEKLIEIPENIDYTPINLVIGSDGKIYKKTSPE